MPYTVTGNGPSECHFPRNQEAIGKCGHSVHLRRTTVYLAPCLFVFSNPTPQQTERAWNSELMRVLEPALEPSFPDPPPLPPLTCFVEVLGSLSVEPVQNMCRCPPLLHPFSVRLRLQLVGLPSVCPHPKPAEFFAEHFIFESLSLAPCPYPHPTPSLSQPVEVWPSIGSVTMKSVGPLHVVD